MSGMVTPRSRPQRPSGPRRRASHSMEAVLNEAVSLLDEAGVPALTFRALAGRLGGGVGSIYWYVSGKDELLDLATDHAVGPLLAELEARPDADDPIDELRTMAVRMFDAIVVRPWLAAYFMRNSLLQPNTMRLYERLGQVTLRLDLTPRQRFHAVSAIVGYTVGTAADLGQEPPREVVDGEVGREEYLARFADLWRGLDPEQYPFVHQIADEFAHHDDKDQFRAGLDLLLAGLRLEAEG
ncbi:TetR/AcrR family transcriptional regulator [Aeromicrobium sp. S22]|nr:TetR/AcrR family transcriptional regulator [Aeromicrobium sp. S22]